MARSQSLENVDVGAGNERAASADENDGVGGRVGIGTGDGVADAFGHTGTERVDGWVVDRHDRPAVSELVPYQRHGAATVSCARSAHMPHDEPPATQSLTVRLLTFMDEHVYPNEATFRSQIAESDRWQPAPIVEELKQKARAAGLW